ncbi:signal peptide protein [Afipia sp. P52-10]|jgi:hypothetical protein|uniref:hypothetical protein n=1 Tax=Afipia sp. P52-10 TaxID=1429916 RepID=UPI0003DF2DFC|nr:hypothetical protein [Afipia sp. P52-10]ETR77404.1 signal peptide protein [Afipia sp. P52-10]
MLQRLVDDVKSSAGSAARLACLGIVMAVSFFVVVGFLAAAAFMYVLAREGAVAACFAGGGVFFLLALIAATIYSIIQQQQQRRMEAARAQAAKSPVSTFLSDPAAIAIGLQLVRTVGLRRMIPLLAIGGVALGLFAGQRREPTESTDDAE